MEKSTGQHMAHGKSAHTNCTRLDAHWRHCSLQCALSAETASGANSAQCRVPTESVQAPAFRHTHTTLLKKCHQTQLEFHALLPTTAPNHCNWAHFAKLRPPFRRLLLVARSSSQPEQKCAECAARKHQPVQPPLPAWKLDSIEWGPNLSEQLCGTMFGSNFCLSLCLSGYVPTSSCLQAGCLLARRVLAHCSNACRNSIVSNCGAAIQLKAPSHNSLGCLC